MSRKHFYGSGYSVSGGGGGGDGPIFIFLDSFTYATASPLVITAAQATDYVMRAEVVIDTTFDGVGAGLRLGTGASPGGILDSTTGTIDVTLANTYRTLNRFEPGATDLQLVITPGAGATQGAGRVFLEIWRF